MAKRSVATFAGNAAFDHAIAWDLRGNTALYLPLINQEGGS
jgi:hypothetical protein